MEEVTIQVIQKLVTRGLNSGLPEEWAAYGATSSAGDEYVELFHEDERKFLVSIVEVK